MIGIVAVHHDVSETPRHVRFHLLPGGVSDLPKADDAGRFLLLGLAAIDGIRAESRLLGEDRLEDAAVEDRL
ncbi:MAG: hypothetical protein M0D55_15870 [Elusimicrobiota bacterium]|nr:MAG: hypothetical protein M0D55_15870 [Elusimicrobiota bacterium]